MAWSIFKDGGGPAAAAQWARDLLATVGAPQSPANVQFVYDWEVSEGGGGKYNPLNQGPVPGHPELTTTGSQYGGGAADFASYAAGVQGAADYLNMPNFKAGVLAPLMADNAAGARAGLIASPWASGHYNGGSSFSNQPIPGGAQSLPGVAQTSSSSTGSSSVGGAVGSLLGLPSGATIGHYAMIAVGAIAGLALIMMGAERATGAHPAKAAAGAQLAAL